MHKPQSDAAQAGFTEKTSAGIERLTSGAHQALDRVAEAATSAAQQVGYRGRELRQMQTHWTSSARDCVRDHPFASIGVALGVGLVLSILARLTPR